MMRSGRLLVEQSPNNLLSHFQLPSLEEVFLKLCIKDRNDGRKEQLTAISKVTSSIVTGNTAARLSQPSSDHVNAAFDDSLSQISVPEPKLIEAPASPANGSEVRLFKIQISSLYLFCFTHRYHRSTSK